MNLLYDRKIIAEIDIFTTSRCSICNVNRGMGIHGFTRSITTGPKNQALEEAFCTLTGNRHAIAVSSATAGMHVTLMALGIGPGDEVIDRERQQK